MQVADRMDEIIKEKKKLLNEKEGEQLSIDDIGDVYIQAMAEFRSRNNMSLATRTKKGDINDYLEVRRPFGANQ